jgi:hypothetical protein
MDGLFTGLFFLGLLWYGWKTGFSDGQTKK